jgi:hypothetical protein
MNLFSQLTLLVHKTLNLFPDDLHLILREKQLIRRHRCLDSDVFGKPVYLTVALSFQSELNDSI